MESKFIIFAVLASLAQCHCALPENITNGLSDKDQIVLGQVIENQDAIYTARLVSLNPPFDIIEKYVFTLIYNLKAITDDDSVIIANATEQANIGHDLVLDSIKISMGEACAVEEARKALRTNTDQAFGVFTSGLKLAASGNFAANQDQLEAHRDKLRDSLNIYTDTVHTTIRSCINTTDEQVLDTIEASRARSSLAAGYVSAAFFNGLFVYAAAVDDGTATINVIHELEEYRSNLFDAIGLDTGGTSSLLRALFLYSRLNLTSSKLPILETNQYAHVISLIKYQQELDTIFDTINFYAKAINLGLADPGSLDFSRIDAAQDYTLAKLNAGDGIALDAILAIHPNATEAVSDAEREFSVSGDALIVSFFDAIRVASTAALDYDEVKSTLKSFRDAESNNTGSFVESYLALIRGDVVFDSERTDQLEVIRNVATERLLAIGDNIFTAIERLAKGFNEGVISHEDVIAIQEHHHSALIALDDYTEATTAIGVLTIQALPN